MKKTIMFLFAALVMVSGAISANAAEDLKGEKAKAKPLTTGTIKTVQGEVVAITKRSISLVYERNRESGEESEILLPYDANNIVVEHKQSLSEIEVGNVVQVKYSDDIVDYGDRKENKIQVRVISYINPGDAESSYKKNAAHMSFKNIGARETKATAGNTTVQESAVSEPLSLKGER